MSFETDSLRVELEKKIAYLKKQIEDLTNRYERHTHMFVDDGDPDDQPGGKTFGPED